METVRVPIQNARDQGVYAEAKAVALSGTGTHLILRREDFLRIKAKVTNPTNKANRHEAVQRWGTALSSVAGAASRLAHGAAGLARSIARTDPAEPQVLARRLAICRDCPESKPSDRPVGKRRCGKLLDVLNPRAKGCGCGLARKASIASETCPAGRWDSAK